MRRTAILLGVILITAVGCTQTRWSMFKRSHKPAVVSNNVPTVEQLVEYLNDNAGRVQSLRSTSLELSAKHGIKPPIGLNGRLVAQKPRDFRLRADTFGKTVVDLGSNEKEFWYWISKADPPYQYYCSYDDLQAGRVKHLPFPFQPDWIMEAMGLGPYGPASRYTMETDENQFRLIEKAKTPQGEPMRKVIVFNRRRTKVPDPQVLAFLLIDEKTEKEICSAHITKTQLDAKTGAVLPYKLELRWPENRFKLGIQFEQLVVNPQPTLPATAFIRRPMPNITSFDLARLRPDSPVSPVEAKRFLK